MWPKLLRSSMPSESRGLAERGGEFITRTQGSSELQAAKLANGGLQRTIDVNEEYRKAFRTKSYMDIWTRIHRHLRRNTATPPRSPPPPQPLSPSSRANGDDTAAVGMSPPSSSSSKFSCHTHLPSYLSEPHDLEALLGTVHEPKLHALFLDFFDASVEACNICVSLLGSIDQLRCDHRSIRRLLNRTNSYSAVDSAEVASNVELENPLSSLMTVRFQYVHSLYESLVRHLMHARDTVRRRARRLRLLKRASGVALVAACGALAAAVLLVGAHAAVALASAGALAAPVSAWVRRRMGTAWSRRRLARLGLQVDAAARGAYIMGREMETMSRMVARLHDEVEHGKVVVRLFLRSGERWVLTGAAAAGGAGEDAFLGQLDELEEHVYWCLLTINRTRGLVAQEIAPAASPAPTPTTSS